MRWYFAIDENGARGETGGLAKLAVRSARAVGGLEPVLLYHGARTELCTWMEAHGVRIAETSPSFWPEAQAAITAGTYKPHSIGHWLRVAIPQIETEQEFVLFTDCDVIFLRRFDFSQVRPKIFAAAPEFKPDAWDYFNAGVMLLNVPAMRATYPAFEQIIKDRIASGKYYQYDDQVALNETYRGHWDRLDPVCNWKPYWDFNKQAAILHYHGPKPSVLESIAAGQATLTNPAMVFFEKMLKTRIEQYLAWSRYLGDSLQMVDLSEAVRFAELASTLTSYRQAMPHAPDSHFLDVNNSGAEG